MAFDLNDYVDVPQRIAEFRKKYPEGTLQSWRDPVVIEVAGNHFVMYCAAAFRTPDDERPGVGWAWEPVPGNTSFTRDSELQNAETSAWGRAIVALGFETKHVASQNEVRNRQEAPQSSDEPASGGPACARCKTTTKYKEGTSKEGKEWKAWMCPNDSKDDRHPVVWL